MGAASCAWPTIHASSGAMVNATLTSSADGKQLIFKAPAPAGATPMGVLYAYGVWPVVTVYSTFTVATGYETLDFPLNGFSVPVSPA